MRPTLPLLLLVVSTTAPLSAEITLRARPRDPDAAPRVRQLSAEAQAAKIALPSSELFLPYYAVDGNSAAGTTTLFAVRNILFDTITLRVEYLPLTGGSVVETTLLDSRETFTRNVRDVAALPSTGGGFKEGWARITARDPVTGDLLLDTYLHGDTFFVTPGENFATGNALEATEDALCVLWDTRFAVGGPFDDTELRLTLPSKAPGAPSIVGSVAVYDEAGDFVGEIDIEADGPVGILYASDILEAIGGGPDFGVFEWDFLDPSFISQEMRAEGRYAAGWAPACLDPAFL
jgi:hypothetical protein